MTEEKKQDIYRDTVFLPKTGFPMRGNLPNREPEILKMWQAMRLDEKLKAQAAGRPVFTLHDGPPYANGHLHIGHALNKIMKDVVNRAHRMSGEGIYYVPGWDCHGLPIEWRVEEEYRKAGKNKDSIPVLQFRQECREYAQKWLDTQKEEFKRLGVQAQWDERYATMDFSSEAAIVNEIGKFLLNGSLYRGLRPVMWSPVEKTALAEAEIEYHDHTSTAIFVAFPIITDPTPSGALEEVSAVIWTTTPWTIPANRALAYGPDITYAVLRVDAVNESATLPVGGKILLAEERISAFAEEAGILSHHVLYTMPGLALKGAVAAHPLRGQGYDYDVPMLGGEFVTTDAGTGLVHMAPAHGEEDFILCREHGVEIDELVMDDGRYVDWLPLFAGVHVFKAADPVCAALLDAMMASEEKGLPPAGLVGRNTIVHSYPHSWRSRAPVIFRATPQWFIAMDGKGRLRQKALKVLENVAFVPSQGRRRLTSMVEDRPDWCISRQRAWGVPIAVFVEKKTGEVLRDKAVMERIVEAFRQEGADAWYSSPPERFLGNNYSAEAFEQVFDIVDVWFESGSTHAFVLDGKERHFPADLYLEGSDQHRGWFQSSLLESVGTRGEAPYKCIVTNGFVLDEQGRKMSKSLGNVVSPQDVNQTYGADILRLWVMNSDTREDLRIGKEILKQQGELYRRLRNTLRWLLGALEGFEEAEKVEYNALPELEKWVLTRLAELSAQLAHAVSTHEWIGVYPAFHGFCTTDLSAFYFDIRKDSIYCDAKDNLTRRAARTVLDILHRTLTVWLAPVLVFTAEEAWMARFGEGQSVHMEEFPVMPLEWLNTPLSEKWGTVRHIRKAITAEIENARQSGLIGSSLQAEVMLTFSEKEAALFAGYDWAELAIVSKVEIVVDPQSGSLYCEEGSSDLPIHQGPIVKAAKGYKCVRCWRVLEEVGQNVQHPELCLRCATVVETL
ncbi:isoleucine--tRNA ligase [Entomobacter blattae]|uniref:Isoleucine--tRNA ligase n=1 Tax=Entomobacter blattae TaxID=2762277 RepID=A0A7H1NUQ7_9PROT|nr:isoleucine--tRNA ligase [Entomobacter blattae]QNT79517.1 Isoleucine--tRNA ligase [Entomobacter blattae]